MKYYIPIILLFLLAGCADDRTEYVLEEAVDSEVLIHLLNFESAATDRDISIDWASYGLRVQLTDIETEAVGRCLTYTDQTRVIELDKTYWMTQDDVQREFVIFHELGHCILDRSHLDEADQQGRCVSLMHSSNDLCRNNYNARTREEFLDELFFNN